MRKGTGKGGKGMRYKTMVWAGAAVLLSGGAFAAGKATQPAAKGYVIAEIAVTDPATYEIYKPKAAALIAKFGGRYLVRGGSAQSLEGDAPPGRIVVLEFASVAAAMAFEKSPEYEEVAKIRQRSARSRVFVVEGTAR